MPPQNCWTREKIVSLSDTPFPQLIGEELKSPQTLPAFSSNPKFHGDVMRTIQKLAPTAFVASLLSPQAAHWRK